MELKLNTETYRDYLQAKKRILDNVVIQLKKEFIGIDSVIDEIAKMMQGWFFFPELQDRPLVINLWGLTGIGKTSLVKRFAELLEFEKQYYRFDLGESTNKEFDIQDTFSDIYTLWNKQPFIIGLDEFQLARTLDEDGREVDKASSRVIWDLLDNGKFDLIDFSTYSLRQVDKLIRKLERALKEGVVVKNGIVVENLDVYRKRVPDNVSEDDEDDDEEDKNKNGKQENISFVPSDYVNTIYWIDSSAYLSATDLKEELKQMDGEQTIDFLIDIYRKGLKPKTVDCTKSLVFIMGNLDEVYSMTHNFNPDINADEFHNESLKITITQVKKSLLGRFRSEQIARLGNNHVIYPAFNEKSFRDIILLELNKISTRFHEISGIQLEFTDSLVQLIFDEGVYPTQGTRPLFTTVYQIVNTKLAKVLQEIFIGQKQATKAVFSVDRNTNSKDSVNIIINLQDGDKQVFEYIEEQKIVLEKLRKEKKDDQQAITAVHESGHAVLSTILMKTLPSAILSVTADDKSLGFVLSRPEWNYVSKKEIINRLAVLFGGIEAERIVFGDENITIGASQDISNATQLATYVVYECGFASHPIYYGSMRDVGEQIKAVYDTDESRLNKEVESLLIAAQELASTTLKQQRKLLLVLSNYLSDVRSVDKEKMKEYVQKYAIDFPVSAIIENADDLFYRNSLKDQFKDS